MKIISRYVLKQFFTIVFFAISASIVLFLIVDIFEHTGLLLDHPASVSIIVLYFASKIPFMLFLTLPITVMLATLISLGLMGKNLELVAMRTCGISHISIITPILIVAFFISIFAFFGSDYLVPKANRLTEYLEIVKIKKKKQELKPEYMLNKIWLKKGDSIYHLDRFLPNEEMIEGITIYRFDTNFNLTKTIEATYAVWTKKGWAFHNVSEKDFGSSSLATVNKYDVKYFYLEEKPDDFKVVFENQTEKMSFNQLSNYIKRLSADGYDTTRYRVDLHSKLSFPLANFIMVLIATPFAIMIGRRGGIAFATVVAFAFSFLYWIVYSICLSLGHGGTLPPFIAAWTANILFVVASIYLFLTVRT
jgi:lipopolysaccharide export system permease protein